MARSNKHHKKHHHHSLFHKVKHGVHKASKIGSKVMDVADFGITAAEIVAPELTPQLEKARTLEEKGKKVLDKAHKAEHIHEHVKQRVEERRRAQTQPISVPVPQTIRPQHPANFGLSAFV